MGCCGQKRSMLKEELRNTSKLLVEEAAPEMKPRVFEYTGDHGLVLRGLSSGTVYNFRHKGEKLEINYYDSPAVMAERDLKVIPMSVTQA
jgi:hypothetical protein